MTDRGPRRPRTPLGFGLVAMLALMALGTTSCSPPRSYVALGDSYSSGPVIPVQQQDPVGCLRSDHNYPHLVQPKLKLPVFRDVSCSGATTDDMYAPQSVSPGPNPPPQLDALSADTGAVSLTIGGNDIGFTSIIKACASPVNAGTPCQDKYVKGGVDELRTRIRNTAPKIAGVLRAIHARSAQAKVFLLGYLAILPESGSCYPQMPVTDGDVPYLRGIEKALNAMLRDQAAANGATYVDAYTPSIGHDSCQKLPTVRWVEPLVPVNPAAPVHPDLAGMQSYADTLLKAMHAKGL
ncbi:MAG: family lipase [Acidimicrobiales bacterium]|nr:family lipase [Acidimicrobiales bacterium]